MQYTSGRLWAISMAPLFMVTAAYSQPITAPQIEQKKDGLKHTYANDNHFKFTVQANNVPAAAVTMTRIYRNKKRSGWEVIFVTTKMSPISPHRKAGVVWRLFRVPMEPI